jgi:type IV pilus biogenesis protein CpaD/CtpE
MFEAEPTRAGARQIDAVVAAVLAAMVAASLAGCASQPPVVQSMLVVPGYYDTLLATLAGAM